ncbi:MAG: hypothetical protein LBM62_01840 [Mediterranea sp.]|jgi:hypothetical protein|nr:hypothetical protein [Mediterranea sp.]
MKKLVFMAIAMIAVSFASCGNKQSTANTSTQDTIATAVEEITTTVVVTDSTATDSTSVVQ